jgi:IS5 family transposase
MRADFEDFVTWMFVTIDDLGPQIAPLYDRPGPDPTSWSDSELITIAMVRACRGWDRETHLIAEWEPYRSLFPHLPERSRFHRRRRNVMVAINQIRQIITNGLDVAQDADGVIDGRPLPVMEFHRAPQRSRDGDAAGATVGSCAATNKTSFGYRLHLVITSGGVILDFARMAANADARDAAADLLPLYPGRTFLADKGYVSAELAERLRGCGVTLIVLRRKNQHAQLPEPLRRLITRFREIIETVNGQLTAQFNLEHNYAHSFWGLCARLYTKLAGHTRCMHLNRLRGNPEWLKIKGLAFASGA